MELTCAGSNATGHRWPRWVPDNAGAWFTGESGARNEGSSQPASPIDQRLGAATSDKDTGNPTGNKQN